MRRSQDPINPCTRSTSHSRPYLYARVLGIFHVNAFRAGDDPTGADDSDTHTIPVLWVRWLDLDTTIPGGFAIPRLLHLEWAAPNEDPYGFVSPDDVLHGVPSDLGLRL